MEENVYYIPVLLPIAVNKPYFYRHTKLVTSGSIVKVPISNRETYGVVWHNSDQMDMPDKNKIRNIISVMDINSLPLDLLNFVEWVSNYYLSPLGNVLKASFRVKELERVFKLDACYQIDRNVLIKETPQRKLVEDIFVGDIILTKAEIISKTGVSYSVINHMVKSQKLKAVENNTQNKIFDPNEFKKSKLSKEQDIAARDLIQIFNLKEAQTVVLDGVTGSGKTEVYMKAIEGFLLENKQALVLLPEIALTSEFLIRFKNNFGEFVAEWHSGISIKQRKRVWDGVLSNNIKIIIGARSSLFLPFSDLGLIVVDEEHESAYKQEEGIIYQARDMALVRSMLSNANTILSSATPSLETYVNIRNQKYKKISLNKRYGNANMPLVSIMDMKSSKISKESWIPSELIEKMEGVFNKREQVLLFLNRRGYAPLTICRKCGVRMECPNCSTWLVEHKQFNQFRCHHCGYHSKNINKCLSCFASDTLVPCGPGIERLSEEVRKIFPDIRIAIMSSDHLAGIKDINSTLNQIKSNNIDLIIGTQLVAKGHHFPFLTLVGVIDADFGLGVTDMRATEKTYQLLHQVSGRAGREKRQGEVILLTHMPEHPVLQAIVSGERDLFYEEEAIMRENQSLPPFTRMISLIISSRDKNKVTMASKKLLINSFPPKDITLLGPIEAPIARIRGRYRMRFLLKGPKNNKIQVFVKQWIAKIKIEHDVKITVDVDPYNFL